MWILYERPTSRRKPSTRLTELAWRRKRGWSPSDHQRHRLRTTWPVVLTDSGEHGISTGAPNAPPTLPSWINSRADAAPLTADTGLDALTQGRRGVSFVMVQRLHRRALPQSIEMIFTYLPRAYENGGDKEAREKMHNAATIAGLAFINSLAAAAHALGHSLGCLRRASRPGRVPFPPLHIN